MPKIKTIFICSSCSAEFTGWMGRCTSCGEWNTISENTVRTAKTPLPCNTVALLLSGIQPVLHNRLLASSSEFNLVCGGGIVPGSVILLSGEPGIGKSTLSMQIAASFRSLYVSGEESVLQLKQRAGRLGITGNNFLVYSGTSSDEIISLTEKEKPECVIIDSIQTVYSPDIAGQAGSVTQIRETASRLIETAKKTGIPFILTGHITKDGSIAGPKILEHIVDTVLYFEGDFSKDFRMIRAFKNRFGSVNETGLFRMTPAGLAQVENRNSLFLNALTGSPGSAVTAAIEGSRTILFEVQSLVVSTNYSNPRRMSDGFDLNRFILLVAVLEKHGFLKLNNTDVFINVAGGFRINEPSADLAVAMAICSSLKNQAIAGKTGFLGEISLSGEIRSVSQCARRIQEFSRSGFSRIIVPHQDEEEARRDYKGQITPVKDIREAIERVF